MGKRIDDLLKLDDRPIGERPVEARDPRKIEPADDLRDQPWFQFVGEIDELLNDDDYHWSFETLSGIRETVERTQRVTEGQRRALANIKQGGARTRRYEGFRGRWS